jgi:glucose uptake protein GlcU
MELIQYTQDWIKGELFEARLITLFSITLIVIALLFYFFGNTPNAKAMLFPLIFVGIIFTSVGVGMLYSNSKRTDEFKLAYQDNPQEFASSEKARCEVFMPWYSTSRWIVSIIGILGVLIFIFWSTPIGRAIGVSLILITLMAFVVDHFSEERANIYYEHITESI